MPEISFPKLAAGQASVGAGLEKGQRRGDARGEVLAQPGQCWRGLDGTLGALSDGWGFPAQRGVPAPPAAPLLVGGCPALCSRCCHPLRGTDACSRLSALG